jgi:MFS family permease
MRPTSSSTLSVAALGTMLALVSFSTPVAAIGPISQALGADVAGRTWMLSAMSIGLGATLLTAGTLADDRGRRRVFVVGLVLLAVASVVGAVATTPLVFTLARAAQGVGNAAVIAASLGLIAGTFAPGPERARASGVWGASVGAGIMVGPLLTSELDRYASWRYAYGLVAVAALTLAVVARRRVAESTRGNRRGLDLSGALTFAGAMCALLAGLVEGRLGWGRPVVLALLVVAAGLLSAFVVVELRSARPMLDLRLFRQRGFIAATVAGFAAGAGVIALVQNLPVFLDQAFGVPATTTAYLAVVWSATSVVTALAVRWLPAGLPGRAQLGIGLLGVAAGQLAMAFVGPSWTWLAFLPGMFVAGVFSGLLNAALGREAVATVPEGEGALGSGANNTARYLGSAVGVTVVAVIAAAGDGTGVQGLVDCWNHAALVTVLVSVVGGLVALLLREPRRPAPAPTDEPAGMRDAPVPD